MSVCCEPVTFDQQCVAGKKGKGRTVSLHPQEALLQQARAFQHSEAFARYRKRRQVAEHRLARLVQLGIRQARYFGRVKTRFQLLMAATVANLTLVAVKMGMMKTAGCRAFSVFFSWLNALITFLKESSPLLSHPYYSGRPIQINSIGMFPESGFSARFLGAWVTTRQQDSYLGCRLIFLSAWLWAILGASVAQIGVTNDLHRV